MNNGKSNTRGLGIGRVVAYLLLAVFCVAIFAPSVTATQWSPTHVFPHIDRLVIRPEYDDGGWHDNGSKSRSLSGNLLGCYDIRVTAPTLFLWFFDMMDGPDSPDQGNGNDQRILDNDSTTSPQ